MDVSPPRRDSTANPAAPDRKEPVDLATDPSWRELLDLAIDACGVERALIALLDPAGQSLGTTIGMAGEDAARHLPFGRYALLQDDLVVVPDTHAVEALAELPAARAEQGARFFAGAPLRSRSGAPIGVLCLFGAAPRQPSERTRRVIRGLARQIEVRVQLEQRLDEATRESDAFVSLVSHELRSPLTSILGALGLATGGVVGSIDEPVAELLRIAHTNSERLLRLVNDIVDLHRLDAGAIELDLSPIDLRDVVSRALAVARPFALHHGVAVEVTSAPEMRVAADFERLVQVVVTLVSSAVKRSLSGEAVAVSLSRRGSTTRLAVTDHGPAIAEAFRPYVFQRRAPLAVDEGARRSAGLGLGLVKSLIDLHGGVVGFATTPDGGTSFHFDLETLNDTTL